MPRGKYTRIIGKNSGHRKGKKHSLESRQKMVIAQSNISKETKAKISASCKRVAKHGSEHHRWKGGYENHLWHARQRIVRKLNNGGFHTLGEWETLKAQYNWTCPGCGKHEPEIKLTEDHIIPLSKGGSDNIENIQPLCKSCNSRKKDKTIKYSL